MFKSNSSAALNFVEDTKTYITQSTTTVWSSMNSVMSGEWKVFYWPW